MDAFLNQELELFGVLVRLDRDVAFPQRAVGGQPLELGGDLAEDVDQPVVFMIFVIISVILTVTESNSSLNTVQNLFEYGTKVS